MIVVLNGPPGSGKDTLAEALERLGFVHRRFKDSLYEHAAVISGLPLDTVKFLATDRVLKEKPNNNFVIAGAPSSPRQFLIHVSETIIKPLLGVDIFGIETAERTSNDGLTVISDSGFMEEFNAILDVTPSTPRKTILVHLFREGCTFEGDSRDYLDTHGFTDPHLKVKKFDNFYATPELAQKAFINLIKDYL